MEHNPDENLASELPMAAYRALAGWRALGTHRQHIGILSVLEGLA